MLNSTLTLSRVGIILNIDANVDDPLFKMGVDYSYQNFTSLFHSLHTETLRKFLDSVFGTNKLQSLDFYNGANFYQLRCIVTQPGQALCIVTNNRKQRKPLSELEEQNYKALVNTYSDWVWSFDNNFTLVTANRAFFEARRQNDNAELHLGDNIFNHAQEYAYKKWKPIYDRALKGEVFCFEEKRKNNNGDYYVEIYLTPVYNDESKIVGCLGVTRNITQRKLAELAIEGYTKKLEEFAFKTSHDLRRPIANIAGMITMLNDKILNEDDKAKTISFIASSIKELDDIVISMIDMIDQYKIKPAN